MSIEIPFKRTYRELTISAKGQGASGDSYIFHPDFAKSSEKNIRGFLLIERDFKRLLDYIEPSDINLKTYSFRTHELIMRTCIEIEANLVAILKENNYSKDGNLTMTDYKKINKTHFLSEFRVKLTDWEGDENIISPFLNWKEGKSLKWWTAYNDTKHNRSENFKNANFKNLIGAISALVVLLSSQFKYYEKKHLTFLSTIKENPDDDYENAVGNYFKVKFPDYNEEQKYSFNWTQMKKEESIKFQTHEYK